MNEKKNILIAPLDWGLGHATRCIPIIQQLRKKHHIILASSGNALELMKKEFPDLPAETLPSYQISYPVRRGMSLHIAFQLPTIYSAIVREKKITQNLIDKYQLNAIISDNRFGVYAKKVPSVFITHQVNIKTPHLNKWINRLNHRFMQNFTHCWIPDYESFPGLAGELSHPPIQNIPSVYIGPLTRFSIFTTEKKYDISAVLSGPEPQRTILEDKLFTELFKFPDLKIKLIRGIYTSNESGKVKNIEVCDHLTSKELEQTLHASKNIICRSGYSSLMDLQKIQACALIIPTPQQTEQEYLANVHAKNEFIISQSQDHLNVGELLKLNSGLKDLNPFHETDFCQVLENCL